MLTDQTTNNEYWKGNTYYKNYTKKIILKSDIESEEEAESFNNFIILLNFSFFKKNNFFIENFNKVKIGNISKSYNQLKTNILTTDINEILYNINMSDLKLFQYIIKNFINKYPDISNNFDNIELCSLISRDSLELCLKKITFVLSNFK
jgi:hypothetical protein